MFDIYSELIVINALIPTAGTKMEGITPPSTETILGYLKQVVECGIHVSLGCMRPRTNKPELERAAIELGVHRISLPSNSALRWAEAEGYNVLKFDACCAVPVSLESQILRPS